MHHLHLFRIVHSRPRPLLRILTPRSVCTRNFSAINPVCHAVGASTPVPRHVERRQRRNDIWIPTVKLKGQHEPVDATQLLIRAGYLRQAYAGIYHVLPLGLRVQEKLELLIDKHMQSIGASKVSLSSVSSQSLWNRSGRLHGGSEFFKFTDRKDAKWLLAPTHEEEITTLVAQSVHSPGLLPIRLYQISRKYRDEKRPRGGLLRGREFIMKDLYTFDLTQDEAYATYDQVRQAYRNLLDELTVPYIEARADSGNMGGNLSHEYHFPSPAGEDDVISCNTCSYARNEEWVPDSQHKVEDFSLPATRAADNCINHQMLCSITVVDTTRKALVKAFAPQKSVDGKIVDFNTYAIKAALSEILVLDTGIEEPEKAFLASLAKPETPSTVYYLFEAGISREQALTQMEHDQPWLAEKKLITKLVTPVTHQKDNFSLLKQSTGDKCPQCSNGTLKVSKAIEVGHTFHLGTRYSSKLDLVVKSNQKGGDATAVEMGCHGIGVSRLLAAVASTLSDETGLNWPAVIAPFQVVIVVDGADEKRMAVATQLYDAIVSSPGGRFDVLLDDRKDVSAGYKLKDADLIGYPVIVVIGRTFDAGKVEIQCRIQGQKEVVDITDAVGAVCKTLSSLLQPM